MKHITFYLDFISPYAFLAFERLPEALEGLSYSVSYQPVLFSGMLKHYGQLGPAEIAPKRDWTYRHVLWLAGSQGVDMKMPLSHPFNPLPLLRLALACASKDMPPNRYVCETVFRHVWQGGTDAVDAQRLELLADKLSSLQRTQADDAKAQLKSNTDAAIANGVFGVPAFEVDGKIFWGLDALPMLRDYLLGGSWFATDEWNSASQVSVGSSRRP